MLLLIKFMCYDEKSTYRFWALPEILDPFAVYETSVSTYFFEPDTYYRAKNWTSWVTYYILH